MLNVQSIRVLDLTDLAGQFAGKILADLGFEVIKVEPPGGDSVRSLPPFRDGAPDSDASLPFLYLNSNKKSITLNLEQERGRVLLKGLARKCDILLESFPPGRLDQWGVGYQALIQENPGLVMSSITGFGQNGPYAGYRSSDLVALAMGGLLNVFGEPDRPPCKPPETQAYYTASAYAALGALFALRRRQITGRGQHVDVSAQETLAVIDQIISSAAPHDCFPCQGRGEHGEEESWCAIAVETEEQWIALCAAIARADLAADPRFATLGSRQQNFAELNGEIGRWTSARDPYEVMHTLQAAGVPCGVVQTGEDLLNDPHLRARQFLVELEHPAVGRLTYPGSPFRLTATPGRPDRLAPELGQHNEYVFGQLLGLSREEIEELQERKVLI